MNPNLSDVNAEDMQKQYAEMASKIEEMAEKIRSMSKEEQKEYLKGLGLNIADDDMDFGDGNVGSFSYLPFVICFLFITFVFGMSLTSLRSEKEIVLTV